MKHDAMKWLLVALMLSVATTNVAFLRTAAAQALEPLAMSYLPGNAIAWDLDVAMDKGLLKAEGYDGRPVVFQNAPQSAQMLITGEVQLGHHGVTGDREFLGDNLLATAAADRAPEQGDLHGRGRARAAEAQCYPGLDLTAWQE